MFFYYIILYHFFLLLYYIIIYSTCIFAHSLVTLVLGDIGWLVCFGPFFLPQCGCKLSDLTTSMYIDR